MSAAIEIKAEELDEVLADIDKFGGAVSGDTAPWLQCAALPAGYGSDDQKRFGAAGNCVRERSVW